MTCKICNGQRFCLCRRLLAPPKPEPGNPRARGDAPIDHALDDVQRLMDETRIRKEALRMADAKIKIERIHAEALAMAEALVKLLEGSK